ncbi:MAG TPA: S9 family peptidase [Gemmatimonadales bacterium]|nr:S9 family peptidase [Gemmatimonadales bacterium]
MRIFSFACLATTVTTAPIAAQQRAITDSDLFAFHWVAGPQISPDGRQVAYVLVGVNAKHDGYETSIWIVATDGGLAPRRLTAGPKDGAPRWSPDGSTLAFLRPKDGHPQIHLLSLIGGEAQQLTDLPKGAGPAAWSPDGKTIAFVSSTTPEDLAKAEKGDKGDKGDKKDESVSDVRVITEAIYRADDEGYLDPAEHSHLWTVPAAMPGDHPVKARQVTSGKFDEEAPQWSRDGTRIGFVSDRVAESYYYEPDNNFYSVPATGGSLDTVANIDGPIFGPAVSSDGRAVAFRGWITPRAPRSYNQSDLFISRAGKLTNLTADYDFDMCGAVLGDQAPPRGGEGSCPNIWMPDGKAVIVTTTEHGRSNLVRFDAQTGAREPLTTGDHAVLAYTATPDARTFALTIGDPTHLPDVYVLDVASKRLRQVTHANDSLFAKLQLVTPEDYWYPSFDGRKVETWILKPAGFTPGKRYPLILNIHGGPHTAYGYIFFHEMQWMAAKGYVVVYPNPRGSTTYGQEFGNIIQYKYPGDDYRDLMIAVDSLIRRGYVDSTRLGVTGGSGGGLLTDWTVGHTHRFAAAVSQRDVADWLGFWYTADFTLFRPTWFRSTPFRDPQEFLTRSPVQYTDSVTTPLMFVLGEEDFRAPPNQGGEAMFRALKYLHKTTVMVRFPGESHELSRSGRPMHRVERLQHILNWFDKYLQGKTVTLYDSR